MRNSTFSLDVDDNYYHLHFFDVSFCAASGGVTVTVTPELVKNMVNHCQRALDPAPSSVVGVVSAPLPSKPKLRKFEDLKGQTLAGITVESINGEDSKVVFILQDGSKYKLEHENDCCEHVTIEDVNGDLQDLLGSPITHAKEVSSEDGDPPMVGDFNTSKGRVNAESFTWTFYQLATIKGWVTIRWYGESNGYYSERVDFSPVEE